MTATHTTKRERRYRYYIRQTARTNGWSECPTKSLPAGEIERAVIDQIRCIGQDEKLVASVLEAASAQAPDLDEAHLRNALALFDPVWDVLHAEEKRRVLNLLIDHVAFDREAGSMEIRFKAAGISALGVEG